MRENTAIRKLRRGYAKRIPARKTPIVRVIALARAEYAKKRLVRPRVRERRRGAMWRIIKGLVTALRILAARGIIAIRILPRGCANPVGRSKRRKRVKQTPTVRTASIVPTDTVCLKTDLYFCSGGENPRRFFRRNLIVCLKACCSKACFETAKPFPTNVYIIISRIKPVSFCAPASFR